MSSRAWDRHYTSAGSARRSTLTTGRIAGESSAATGSWVVLSGLASPRITYTRWSSPVITSNAYDYGVPVVSSSSSYHPPPKNVSAFLACVAKSSSNASKPTNIAAMKTGVSSITPCHLHIEAWSSQNAPEIISSAPTPLLTPEPRPAAADDRCVLAGVGCIDLSLKCILYVSFALSDHSHQ